MNLKMKREIIDNIVVTYASDHILLPENGIDCNEGCNPYGFPEEVKKAIKDFDVARLGPYPHSNAVTDAIHEYWKQWVNIGADNIMLTDGSVSALYIINELFAVRGGTALGIAPQFTDFEMLMNLHGMEYKAVSMDKKKNFKIEVEAVLEKIEDSLCMVYVDNPNNPTGQVIPLNDIERIVKKAAMYGIPVIIDEAYGEFMSKENSAILLINKYENLVLMKTMSKGFGLAGLRVGFIVASDKIIKYMKKTRNPYQVGELSRQLAGVALKHADKIADHVKDFKCMKQQLRDAIGNRLHMAETCDTVSICLLYFDDPDVNLKRLFFEKGVLCVEGSDFKTLNNSYVRIRMPKKEDFNVLLKAAIEIDRFNNKKLH